MTDSPAEKEPEKPLVPEEGLDTEHCLCSTDQSVGKPLAPQTPDSKDSDPRSLLKITPVDALKAAGRVVEAALPGVKTLRECVDTGSLEMPPLGLEKPADPRDIPKPWPPAKTERHLMSNGRPAYETVERDDKGNYVITTKELGLSGSYVSRQVRDEKGRLLEDSAWHKGLDGAERSKLTLYNPETGEKQSFSLNQKNKDGTGCTYDVKYLPGGGAEVTVKEIQAKLARGEKSEHQYIPKPQPERKYSFSKEDMDKVAAQFDDTGDVANGRKFLADMGGGEPAIAMAVLTRFGHGSSSKAGLAYVGKIGRNEAFMGVGTVGKDATPADLRRGVEILTELGGGDMTRGGFAEGYNRFMRLGGYHVKSAFDSALLMGQGDIATGIDRIGRLGTVTGEGRAIRDHIAGLENIEWVKGRDVGGKQGVELLAILGDGDVDKGIAALAFLGGGNVRTGIYRLAGFGDYRHAATIFRDILGSVLDGKPPTTEAAKKVLERLGGNPKDAKAAFEQLLRLSGKSLLQEKDNIQPYDRLDEDLTVVAKVFADLGGGSATKACDVCSRTGKTYDKDAADKKGEKIDGQKDEKIDGKKDDKVDEKKDAGDGPVDGKPADSILIQDGLTNILSLLPKPEDAVKSFQRLGEIKDPASESKLTYNPDLAADNFIGISAKPLLDNEGKPVIGTDGKPVMIFDGGEAARRYARLGALHGDGDGNPSGGLGIDVALRLTTRLDPVTGQPVADATRVLPVLDDAGDNDRGRAVVNLEAMRKGSNQDVVTLLQRAADDHVTVSGGRGSGIDNVRNTSDAPVGHRTVADGIAAVTGFADRSVPEGQTFAGGLRNLTQVDKHAPISQNILSVRAMSDSGTSFAGGTTNLSGVNPGADMFRNIASVQRLGNPDGQDSPGAFRAGLGHLREVSPQMSTSISLMREFGARPGEPSGNFDRGVDTLLRIDRHPGVAIGQVKQFGDNGTFAGGMGVLRQISTDMSQAVEHVSGMSDSGRFSDGARVLRDMTPSGRACDGVAVVKSLSADDSFAGGMHVMRSLSTDGTMRSAVANLAAIGGGNSENGARILNAYAKAANVTVAEAAALAKTLGLGNPAVGMAAIEKLGGQGGVTAGAAALARLGAQDPAIARAVALSGNGDLAHGISQIEAHLKSGKLSSLAQADLAEAARQLVKQEKDLEDLLRRWQSQAASAGHKPLVVEITHFAPQPATAPAVTHAKEAVDFINTVAKTLAPAMKPEQGLEHLIRLVGPGPGGTPVSTHPSTTTSSQPVSGLGSKTAGAAADHVHISHPGPTVPKFLVQLGIVSGQHHAGEIADKPVSSGPSSGVDWRQQQGMLFIRSLAIGSDAGSGQITNARALGSRAGLGVAGTVGIGSTGSGVTGPRESSISRIGRTFPGYGPVGPGTAGNAIGTSRVFTARWDRKKRRDLRELPGVEIALAAVLLSGGVARLRFDQGNKPGDGVKRLKRVLQLARLAGGEDNNNESTQEENRVQTNQYQLLKRPTWLVRAGEDLLALAGHLFHDRSLGWLIADLNLGSSKQTMVEGRRLVELRQRQRIELPVWQDIVQFNRTKDKELREENLVTVVVETAIEAELVQAVLANVIGGGMKPAFAATAAATVTTVTIGLAPQDNSQSASQPEAATKTRKRKVKTPRALAAKVQDGESSDEGPSASAPVTEEVPVVLEPKYV